MAMKIDLEKSKQNLLLIETVASQKYLQVVSATVKCSAQDCLLVILVFSNRFLVDEALDRVN